MPTARIPLIRFRENQMDPTEQGFLRVFGDRLAARGFRFTRGKRGKYIPDPPISYQRDEQFLHLTQDIATGRVKDRHPMLQSLLVAIRNGQPDAVEQLKGFLLAEGDDRLAVVESILGSEGGAAGSDGQAAAMLLSDPRDGSLNLEAPQVPSSVLADRRERERVLLLFGVRQEEL